MQKYIKLTKDLEEYSLHQNTTNNKIINKLLNKQISDKWKLTQQQQQQKKKKEEEEKLKLQEHGNENENFNNIIVNKMQKDQQQQQPQQQQQQQTLENDKQRKLLQQKSYNYFKQKKQQQNHHIYNKYAYIWRACCFLTIFNNSTSSSSVSFHRTTRIKSTKSSYNKSGSKNYSSSNKLNILPKLGASSFVTIFILLCLELVLLSTVTNCAKTFYMHWNTSNSM